VTVGLERIGRARLAALAVLALLLVASAIWLYSGTASRRAAETDRADAVAAARESIVEMLSYRPDTAEAKLNAVRDRLTGPFLESFNQLIQTVVIPGAKQKKITAAAQVPAAAAVSGGADRAVVLAYVDQSLAIGSAAPTRTNSSVRVTMEKVDGRWLIAGFDPI
jgi:Mce-associated membrane protein